MRFRNGSVFDCANPVNRTHPLNLGCVAWWKTVSGLAGGAIWHDLMSLPGDLKQGNHGVLSGGATWTSGPALQFDGISGYADTKSRFPRIFNGVSTVATIVYRAKPGAPTIDNSSLPIGVLDRTNSSLRCVLGNDGATNNNIQALVCNGTWPNNFVAVNSTATTLVVGTWYHVAIVLDLGTRTNSRIYVNGQQVTSSIITNGTPPTVYPVLGSGNITLGFFDNHGAGWYNGFLDNVQIYSRALSPAEAQQDYTLSTLGYPGVLNRVGSAWGKKTTIIMPPGLLMQRAI